LRDRPTFRSDGTRNDLSLYAVKPAKRRILKKETAMLYWALMFLVIALVAAVLGFGTLAGASAWIAQVLFVLFLVLFIVSLLFGARRPIP
jgi:uncharacterized membrane protein YtjA (UPF0391 family)